MGNCLFGGLGEAANEGLIKVVTSNGGIMEFIEPITAGNITNEFPGHGIFRNQDLFWKPLSSHEELVAGQSYYLLPLNGGQIVKEGHVRSNSIPTSSLDVAPYRMSLDYQGMLKRSYTEAFSRHNNNNNNNYSYNNNNNIGNATFWKVKLVISPVQLLDILSQERRTQELIESVRTVAKCGSGNLVSSVDMFSDQWSLSSSSMKASSKLAQTLIDI